MASDRIPLLVEDFTDLPLGPIPNDYSPWGEYHCRTDQGRLGRWTEATTLYGWRGGGGAWWVKEDDGRRVMEQTLHAERSYPLIVAGDAGWGRYAAEVELRLLSFAAPTGLVVAYTHSRDFLALLASQDAVSLVRFRHDRRTEFASEPVPFDCHAYRRLTLDCTGPTLIAYVDGEQVFEVEGAEFSGGPVGLIAHAPARFARLCVAAAPDEITDIGMREERLRTSLVRLRDEHPRPKLWREIATPGFGTDRNLRVGDLDGDGENEIVLAQHARLLGSGDYCEISALTALRASGEVLWQVGEPAPQGFETTADLCFQVHDLDNDGRAEVIYTRGFELRIADGATGETLRSIPTPATSPPKAAGAYPLARIIGDCLYFADIDGAGRRDSVVLKDRYAECWVYDAGLGLRWSHACKTGHYPASYDLDGDGREELLTGYTLLSPDGDVIWELDAVDHMDSAVIGPFGPEGALRVAIAGSDAGLFLLDPAGNTLRHHPIGHAQTICVAKLLPDEPGLQLAVNTYWGEPGVTLILDAEGDVLREFEPMHYACLLQPVNWGNDGTDLLLLSPHPAEGGLIDGHGRRVVMFPDDGHPVLCSDVKDIDGDGVDEILAWDCDSLWIYKPDPAPARSPQDYPLRNPACNDSNYRGQFSFPKS